MKIYVPSWNGDLRLEGDGAGGSVLVLHQATPHELTLVGQVLVLARKRKMMVGDWSASLPGAGDARIAIGAPLEKTSKLLIKVARPEKQTLTAVSCAGGRLEVIEGASSRSLETVGAAVAGAEASESTSLARSEPAGPPAVALLAVPEPASSGRRRGRPPKAEAAAVSVRRATPSCPQCMPGAVGPATETLLAFLGKQQHEQWAEERAIVVEGGTTGHRYLLVHRHTPLAMKIGRICYDLDDGGVVHFHDWSVPPEEEVLGAKLVLEHREHWLRNEATCLGACFTDILPNPFGDFYDGIPDAAFVRGLGEALGGASR